MSLSAEDLTAAFSTAFKSSTFRLDIRALDIDTEDKFESTVLYHRWITQFDRMMAPYANREPKEKKAMLLIAIGENAASKYDLELEVTGQADEYKNARLQLENVFCVPDASAEAKVRFFRIRPTQEDATKPLQFLNKLKAATTLCEFEHPDHEVMRVMLSCCPNQKWQEKRINSKWTHVNLKEGEAYARTLEAMTLLTKEIRTSYVNPANKVNAVKSERNGKTTLPKCGNCGGGHQPYPSGTCPAYGQECFACKGRNHYQAFCRSSNRGRLQTRGFRGYRRPNRGSYRGSFQTNRGRGTWRGRNSGQRRGSRRRGNWNNKQQSSVRAITAGTSNGSNNGEQNQIVPYRGEQNSDSFDQRASECLRNLNLTL